MRSAEMIATHPGKIDLERDLLARTVDALVACSQACTACADTCLSEDMVDQLRSCIHANLDCADICDTTARVLSRHTSYDPDLTRAMLQACIQACRSCGKECAAHAEHHEHCRICAEACRVCEQACTELLTAIG